MRRIRQLLSIGCVVVALAAASRQACAQLPWWGWGQAGSPTNTWDPELVADYTGGIEGLNIVAAIGYVLVGLGALVGLVSLAPLVRTPEGDVPADPWEGQSLEWLTTSPPPLENFEGELAPVTSAEPLYDLREEK